ncbi:hypothetical protein PCL1606_60530 [Pseudomonas chlororaphis]|uniref:Uncharacterized protein n=1 Tax=Pseudomonas chlororaphis TaxID=587753 RepID=A0A0D5Y849_9PSED|nr:hypothetical protein PCL1606_60530 [Pseudomonas chlororaphis]
MLDRRQLRPALAQCYATRPVCAGPLAVPPAPRSFARFKVMP